MATKKTGGAKLTATEQRNRDFLIQIVGLKVSKSKNEYVDIDDIEDNVEKLLRFIFTLGDRGKLLIAVSKTSNTRWCSFREKFLSNLPEKRRAVIFQVLNLFYQMHHVKNADERGEIMEVIWEKIESNLHNVAP